MSRTTFTVDTQLFRELGELLVGEDATALTELVKNSYDADSRVVSISGQSLGHPDKSIITVVDDGIGMNQEQFSKGFLTIAGREKITGDRRSRVYRRIFTGEKGVGRLAARKLAKRLEVESWPWSGKLDLQGRLISQTRGIRATIDWDKIDRCKTFDDIPRSGAVQVESILSKGNRLAGTTLKLRRLRKSWTKKDIEKFQRKALTFRPPSVFVGALPETFLAHPLLLEHVFHLGIDGEREEPFRIDMLGAFDILEVPGVSDAAAAHWVLEILSEPKKGRVTYAMSPSQKFHRKYPKAQVEKAIIKIRRDKSAIPFRGRIYNLLNKSWDTSIAGVRVYMNGFRVLPYGETKNDWLGIDDDTTSRARDLLQNLKGLQGDIPRAEDTEEETKMQRNSAYWGAIALNREEAPQLEMLVNREGFAPGEQLDFLTKYVRIGVDLLTRVRVSSSIEVKRARIELTREQRRVADDDVETPATVLTMRNDSNKVVEAARDARAAIARGDVARASEVMRTTIEPLAHSIEQVSREMGSEQAIFRVLASIGAQQAAFSHEINGLVSTAAAVISSIDKILEIDLSDPVRRRLGSVRRSMHDLYEGLERQAFFLTDIAGLESRRRRSRQSLAARFDAAKRLLERQIEERGISLIVNIPTDLKSPAMFPAEVVALFTNLLSNAVKFAGKNGKITLSGNADGKYVRVRIENTGTAVELKRAEKWFEPFQSTTTNVDASLGQGMGLGLTITRSLLDEYGASIEFVQPIAGYATAIEVTFPR